MKHEFILQVIDSKSNAIVFEHYFDFVDGKLKFLPCGNEIKQFVKMFIENESEFDPK